LRLETKPLNTFPPPLFHNEKQCEIVELSAFDLMAFNNELSLNAPNPQLKQNEIQASN
jgi:hypothetical protein